MLYGLFHMGLFGALSVAIADTPAASLSVSLSQEVLAGQAIPVELSISNQMSVAIDLPDLSARPWLVKFDLVGAGGGAQEGTPHTSWPVVLLSVHSVLKYALHRLWLPGSLRVCALWSFFPLH